MTDIRTTVAPAAGEQVSVPEAFLTGREIELEETLREILKIIAQGGNPATVIRDIYMEARNALPLKARKP